MSSSKIFLQYIFCGPDKELQNFHGNHSYLAAKKDICCLQSAPQNMYMSHVNSAYVFSPFQNNPKYPSCKTDLDILSCNGKWGNLFYSQNTCKCNTVITPKIPKIITNFSICPKMENLFQGVPKSSHNTA